MDEEIAARPFSAYEGNEPYFFVSYAHADAALVYPELVRLREMGFNIWYDEGIAPGADWPDELAAAIRGAAGFLYAVTNHSVMSEQCRREVNFALERGCPFFAIHLERVELPDGLSFTLGTRQAILKYALTDAEYLYKLRRLGEAGADLITLGGGNATRDVRRRHALSPKRVLIIGVLGILLAAASIYFYRDAIREPDAPVRRVAISEQPSIAILPFTNMSGDEANLPFTAGIHDDLLTHLSRVKSLRTLSRTSVLQYRDTTKTIPQIGKELGVDNILEGSVQRAGSLVRINLQLIDAPADEHLWANIYDRELTTTNLFAVQGEIAAAVADALRVTLLPEEKAAIVRVPTQSMAAFELYLLGRHEWYKFTAQSIELSRDYFRQALEADPEYVLAMSGLADAYIQLVEYGNMRGEEAYPFAEAMITKAMALDSTTSEVWASLGSLRSATGNIEGSEVAFKRAIELDPKNFAAWLWYGDFLRQSAVRRYKESLAAWLRAEALEPMSRPLNERLIAAYHRRGMFEQNSVHQRRLMKIDPGNAVRYQGHLAGNMRWPGKIAESIARLREVNVQDPNFYHPYVNLVLGYLIVGDIEEATRWAERGDKLNPFVFLMSNVLVTTRQYDQIISRLPASASDALFQLYYAKDDIENARTHLTAYIRSINNQLIIRPGNYENTLNLRIADFWLHHGSQAEQARARALIEEMRSNIGNMIEQDFRQPKTYFIYAYAQGLAGNEAGLLDALDRAIDAGWRDRVLTPLLGPLVTHSDQVDLRMQRMETLIKDQQRLLAGMQLAAYLPPADREPVRLGRERLQRYIGDYTNGDTRYKVSVTNSGELLMSLGRGFESILKAISLNEFIPDKQSYIRLVFEQDDSGKVTQVIRKSSVGDTVLKVIGPPPAATTVAPSILAKYVGDYAFNPLPGRANVVNSDLEKMTVTLAVDGTLWIKVKQRGVFETQIVPYADDSFFAPGHIGAYRFDRGETAVAAERVVRVRDGVETIFDRTDALR